MSRLASAATLWDAGQPKPTALAPKLWQGAPRKLTESWQRQIIEEVKRNPRAFGFKHSNWDGRLFRRRTFSAFGIECSLSTIYNILKRGGLTKQRPPRLYGECDEKTKEDFKKKSGG